MSLSNELISQFVKAAKEEKKTDTESTVYGTIVYDGRTYVQLDGSEILTPVETTADTVPGNRVTVMIKNHTATVTGNLSAPAINENSEIMQVLEYDVAEFDRIVANKVDTELLVAEQARIDTLVADNVTIKKNLTAAEAEVKTLKADNATIKGELKAAEADIEDLYAKKLSASDASITYATIESLNVTNADVHNLEATYGDFQQLTANKLTAIDGTITRLQADKLDANTANITYAKITELEAVEADIESLDADVANIDTLIFGSASGNTIQSSFANAVIAQLGNAQIKSAMIDTIAASKIASGDIVTDNIRVKSQNGLLLISDETIQISDNSRVRVQIGKDASNDYSINVWDADGNLMFSKGGITDSAIKNAIIRNDMVSDTANIAAHKLDIDSLFEEINGSTNTIKSTQIHLDDKNQTLNVAFKNLETNVGSIDTTVKSHGTAISAVQGQISSKVWQQDIDASTAGIEIGGRNLFGFHNGSRIKPLTDTSTSVSDEETYGATVTIAEAVTGISLRLDKLDFNVIDVGNEPFTFSAVISASVDDIDITVDICDERVEFFKIGTVPQKIVHTAYPNRYCEPGDNYNGFVDVSLVDIPAVGTQIILEKIKVERGNKATDFTVAPEDLEYVTDTLDEKTNTLNTKYSSLEQTVSGITSTVASHTTELGKKANSNDVTAVRNEVTTLKQTTDTFKTTVENTYATKSEVGGINSQVESNKTAITQNARAIESRATKTELTNAIDSLDIGGRNLLLGTSAIVEVPVSDDFVSQSKQKIYSFVPSVAKDVKAFVLDFKNSGAITLSFDVNIPKAYKNTALSLSRIGAYMPFTLTHKDGTKSNWYGTHTFGCVKTNRHTIETIDENSLVNLPEDETVYIGRYSCYVVPSTVTVLNNFYANPDDYTVTCSGVTVEFNGFTTGGTISNVKMEIGTKATDWTPAPEDLETRVSSAESVITQNSDSITSLVTKTTANEQSISSLQQTSTSLTSRVSSTETELDKLEVGARNLAVNTAGPKTHTVTSTAANDSWYTCNPYWTHGIRLEVGQTYTLSFDYSLDWGDKTIPTEASRIGPGIGSDNGTNDPDGYIADTFAMVADLWDYGSGKYESGKFVYTFTNTKTTDLYFAFRMLRSLTVDVTGVVITVSNFKLEKGNRPTDWSPAPEDMATAKDNDKVNSAAEAAQETASNAETLIRQLTDNISTLVTDGNGTSLMTQTEDGWTFSTADIQTAVSDAAEALSGLTDELGDANHTIDVLRQAVDDLGEIAEYVKISTYENEPCIELGEGDSDFKLYITNTRILFMEGSNIVAHVSNQSLHIKKAVIEKELKQGGFVWKARSNGNLGLVWEGVSS